MYYEEIKYYLYEGKDKGYTYMIVYFDAGYYVKYVSSDQNVEDIIKYMKGNLIRVMEVYNYELDLEEQLREHRAYHIEPITISQTVSNSTRTIHNIKFRLLMIYDQIEKTNTKNYDKIFINLKAMEDLLKIEEDPTKSPRPEKITKETVKIVKWDIRCRLLMIFHEIDKQKLMDYSYLLSYLEEIEKSLRIPQIIQKVYKKTMKNT